ncbi:kinase-like domain-containing protein [Earliella scabrosa]|nr:kinase-like domain-containing protein [Earliella scabrosa]
MMHGAQAGRRLCTTSAESNARPFFETPLAGADIEEHIKRDPPRRHPQEDSHDGFVQAAESQPLPMLSEDDALRVNYIFGDFGRTQPSRLHSNHTIAAAALRSPEVYLGAPWDKPAEIWSFGCLVFELTTSQPLFGYQNNSKFGLTEVENMLYQMQLLTDAYFGPLDEVAAVASVVGRCLRLDPADRTTAEELLRDPWFEGAKKFDALFSVSVMLGAPGRGHASRSLRSSCNLSHQSESPLGAFDIVVLTQSTPSPNHAIFYVLDS